MFNDRGVLTDRARGVLFWFTITMIVLVAIIAVVTILRACRSVISQVEPALAIIPAQVELCTGVQRQFTVEGETEVTWEATGGTVTQSGLYTAGNAPGEYEVTASGRESRQEASAAVSVVVCAPTATPLLPTPTPAPTATPEPVAAASDDAQGDVGAYDTGAPMTGVPAGVDIKTASVQPDLRLALQPTEGVPAELAAWAGEGDVLLWISLHEPIADPPVPNSQWLFVLDVDGSTATGRTPGSRRINPDLGDEIAVWVTYTAGGAYEASSLVWDTNQGGWADGPAVRYTMDESRTLVALAMPLDALSESLAQAGGASIVPEAVKGRAAAESYVGEARVIDFYPNLP